METEATGRKGKIFIFVIALLGAFILWMYAIGYDTELSERTYSGVSVELSGINSNGYTVADGDHFTLNIDVQVSGTRSVLNRSDVSDFRAYVDISAVSGPGYTTLPITVVAPNGLTIEGLSVPNVTLYIDTFTSRTIPVQVEQTYTSAYEIGRVQQSLSVISVYGPESVIGTAEAYCSFSLGQVTDSAVHVSGEVYLRDSDTKATITNPYITISNNTVDVTFYLYDRKPVPIELVLSGGMYLAQDVQFYTSLPSATLCGPVEEIAQISALRLVCDETTAVNGRLNGTMSLKELLEANSLGADITVELPEAELTYTVILPAIRYRTVRVPISRITVYGLPDDGSVRAIADRAVDVTIFGQADSVLAYDGEQMTIRVDYRTLIRDPSIGDFVGRAEIDTGSNAVCVDGSEYRVVVRVTGT